MTIPVLPAVVGIFVLLIAAIYAVAVLRRSRDRREFVLIDGSNVLYWRDETPDLAPLQALVGALRDQGLVPVVWFDANVGYLISGRYLGEGPLSRALGLPTWQVSVAPKGTPADPLLLEAAGKLGARIVTNDRYRDWFEAYPILNDRELLIKGRWRAGRVEVDLAVSEGAERAA